MLLLIDIGNTNIVVGCYENEKITQEARLATDALKTSDQYCMDLTNLLALYEIQREAVTGVIISSVVPPVLNSVRTAVMKLTGKKPLVVGPGIKTGLNILLDNPAAHHDRHGYGNDDRRRGQKRRLYRRQHLHRR